MQLLIPLCSMLTDDGEVDMEGCAVTGQGDSAKLCGSSKYAGSPPAGAHLIGPLKVVLNLPCCAGTFDFDLEEQELDEVTVRHRVLEEMRYYSSSRLAQKSSSGAQSQASSQTAETLSA